MPIGYKILKEKWVFKIKKDSIYKTRWIVKDYEQIEDINYQEIFTAVARANTYRTLLTIAAILD